jgi:hypothetical protein
MEVDRGEAAFAPDRYLVCGDRAYDSVSSAWASEAGAGSLLQYRLSSGLIEPITLDGLASHLAALATQPCGIVFLVMDPLDAAAAMVLRELSSAGQRLPVRFIELANARRETAMAMNAPDASLLASLTGGARGTSFVAEPRMPPESLAAHLEALAQWEHIAREYEAQAFANAYPDFADRAVPWRQLLGLRPAIAPVATFVRDVANTPASNDTWYPLLGLAAMTAANTRVPRQVSPPADSGLRCTVTLSPLESGKTFVVFEAGAGEAARYANRLIRIRWRGDDAVPGSGSEIGFGPVNDRGAANIEVDAPMLGSLSMEFEPPLKNTV